VITTQGIEQQTLKNCKEQQKRTTKKNKEQLNNIIEQ
jgi:hypothetical protein